MTPDELINVIATCHQAGVRVLRTADLLIKFGPAPEKPEKPAQVTVQPAPELSTEKQEEIKHKIEEMEGVMKLDDKNLLERMFPSTVESDPELTEEE